MSSKGASRKRPAEKDTYESDGGFVEDAAKSSKRSKDGAGETIKLKEGTATGTQEDEEGNAYWEIRGNKRRVTLSTFKGTTLVNIREYYEKDGKMLPGKKGISLSVDSFAAVIENLPAIERALKEMGTEVPRPNYDTTAAGIADKAEDDEEAEDTPNLSNAQDEDEEEDTLEEKPTGRLDRFKMKKNHEETSDEGE